MRRFVLIMRTNAELGKTESSSSLRKLKQSMTIADFIEEHLALPLIQMTSHQSYMRSNSYFVIGRQNDAVITWSFTEYNEDNLLSAVSHLTKEELINDLKELLPLKENWS
jgi:hypothetical protein